jgi:RNA polymerase sigma factor (TIGR02999 family)
MADPTDVTRLLHALSEGSPRALDELMPLVYEELRAIASRYLRGEREGHTLNTTALVHEAYMKLVDIDEVDYRDRGHFYAVASTAMRRILIDHARARRRDKRGGGAETVSLDQVVAMTDEQAGELLALDEALGRLEAIDGRRARLVEYRFFGGLTFPEAAEALGVSVATAKREWAVARAWLNRELEAG